MVCNSVYAQKKNAGLISLFDLNIDLTKLFNISGHFDIYR